MELSPFLSTSITDQFTVHGELNLQDKQFVAVYDVAGPLQHLTIPMPTEAPKRVEGLWESTCFEVFLKNENQLSYEEFNFSPTGNWHHMNFSSYRNMTSEASEVVTPKIELSKSENEIRLEVKFTPQNIEIENICCNLTVILETKDLQKHYYALKHPKESEPDFHHKDGFIYRING